MASTTITSQNGSNDETIATTCPYCGVGCGVSATKKDSSLIATDGDASHPANVGRLCVKGVALKDTVTREGRLLAPKVNNKTVSWDTAINAVALGFENTIKEYGPESVAFYLSGQLLTEDYYVANKLMKGFLGSANVDTNSRLCMASAVAAYKRSFGEDVVPCDYGDVECCDLLVLVGSNAAWTHPVLYQRIVAAKATREFKVVVVDPRETATCDIADLHLRLTPGTDAYLFAGLLEHLIQTGAVDGEFVAQHTNGSKKCFEQVVGALDIAKQATGIGQTELEMFFDWFAATERVVTMYSQGVNQSESGTDKCNAIINCHLATGRIGKVGMGPFSITGQPNAMGGREVGGMANQLAAHMDFSPEHVARVGEFWRAPHMAQNPGLKAVEMFSAIADGDIKAVWIMGTNPVVSLPESDRVRSALASCPLVVVSDCVETTDTTLFADVLLPAAPWGEKDGTVTNSERCISRQRRLFPLTGQAKPDWEIVCSVAAKMGYRNAFSYASSHEIFCEHALLTRFAKEDGRQFDIAELANLTAESYDALRSVQWPTSGRPFENRRFSTPDARANFVPVSPRMPVQMATRESPVVLNTGRLRDQWHTMTRTGLAPKLFQHTPVPRVSLSAIDMADCGIENGSLVELRNENGAIRALAEGIADGRSGQAFMPIHWAEQYAWPVRVSALASGVTDPVSGQPESKHLPVALRQVQVGKWLAIATLKPIDIGGFRALFWARRPELGSSRLDIALEQEHTAEALREQLKAYSSCAGVRASDQEWLIMEDSSNGQQRLLMMVNRLPIAVAGTARQWKDLPDVGAMLQKAVSQRPPCSWQALSVLVDNVESSPVICTCFEISSRRIESAINAGAKTLQALGKRLECGTNCGSCIPELNRMLRANGDIQSDCHNPA